VHNGSLLPDTELGHLEINGEDAEKFASSVARERNKWSWEDWGRNVDRYLTKLEYMLAPDLFIIGGGVSADPESFSAISNSAECKIVRRRWATMPASSARRSSPCLVSRH